MNSLGRLLFFGFLGVLADPASDVRTALAEAAEARAKFKVVYDPTYFRIPYPNGDVPANRGVCTDVVIRSYRTLGVDLQKLVHEDMEKNFKLYPALFGLKRPDSNIDHRRVPNLEVFFKRFGEKLPTSRSYADYLPGDIVTWNLPGGLRHIGLVVQKKASGHPLIMHNIGQGDVLEDVLFDWPIAGHFRYPRARP